jgi:hypothetical protein
MVAVGEGEWVLQRGKKLRVVRVTRSNFGAVGVFIKALCGGTCAGNWR